MGTGKNQRAIAVLKLPKSVAKLIEFIRSIITAMTGNTWFPTASIAPPLAVVATDTASLDAAQTVALTRVKGAASARDDKKLIVVKEADGLRASVQGVADANPAHAEAIILSAGMFVKGKGGYSKDGFTVTHGEISGSVILSVKAVEANASYEWQQRTADGTYINLPTTRQCKTTVAGLTPGTMYYFRFRAVLRKGEGNYSQEVRIIVI